MSTFEHFSDNEMEAFFDTELQKQVEEIRTEQEQTIVLSRLWDAVESLEMDLAVGKDPATHEDDFTVLVKEIKEIISVLPANNDPEYSREDHIRAIANQMWDDQIRMLGQISSALDTQLHGALPASEKALVKKHLMARILIIGEGNEQWLTLADTLLDGDALDSNNPEDFEFIAKSLEVAANIDNSPEMKLYNNMLTLLGVPGLDVDIPDGYDMDELELLTYAARDITEATFCTADQSQQPDRHSKIHEVIQSYRLAEDVDLSAVLELADSYAELKASEK